jgi:hypothetical protein
MANKKIVGLLVIVILTFITMSFFLKDYYEEKPVSNEKSFDLIDTDYLVTYTSYTVGESYLTSIKKNSSNYNKVKINDGALENLKKIRDNYFVQSRGSGNTYIVETDGNITKKTIPSKRSITNSFKYNEGIAHLTNGGLHIVEGKKIYKSGISYMDKDHNFNEFLLDKGFFTDAISLNNHFYVLTFNPTIEEEQLLKLNQNGKEVKRFILSKSKPNHTHNSLTVLNDTIYLVSNDGVLSVIKNDKLKEFNIGNNGEVFKVLKSDQSIYVAYFNGVIQKIKDGILIYEITLQVPTEDYDPIFIDFQVREDKYYLLSTFKGRDTEIGEYIGDIFQFNKNGKQITNTRLPVLEETFPSSFAVIK